MKTLFIEARSEEKIKIPSEVLKKLPKRICIATTVQYMDSLSGIQQQLEESGRKIVLFKGEKTKYQGQILGCEIDNVIDADYLYIGDGRFHPLALKLKSSKKVYVYNPYSKKLSEIEEKEVSKWRKKRKGALLKYHTAENIGIIVSTKPGQNNMKQAIKLKEKLKGKAFLFVCDTLDFNQLENFNFIDVWVNTMCPRIAYDDSEKFNKPVINILDIP